MKNFFTFFCATIALAGLVLAAWDYDGPEEGRKPLHWFHSHESLGWLAQHMDVSATADVIEDGGPTQGFPYGFLKVNVVNAIYGCTNGQELVIIKDDTTVREIDFDSVNYDPNFEYYPTNNSRIVFAGVTRVLPRISYWKPKDWNLPPQPEIFLTPTNPPSILYGATRSWWYDGYQDNLPYTHLTNLVRIVRTERSWTNYYHAVRDAVPTPTSPRVWQDSFYDIVELLERATQAQFDYVLNDPLFPAEMYEMRQYIYDYARRYGEDE